VWSTGIACFRLDDFTNQNGALNVKDAQSIFRHLINSMAGQVILATEYRVPYPF